MDKKTQEYIQKSAPPKELLKKLFKKDTTWKEHKEKMMAASKDKRFSKEQRDAIRNVVEHNEKQGLYDRQPVVVDPKVAQQVEKHHEDHVKRGIAEGRIERFDPSKDPQAARLMRKK